MDSITKAMMTEFSSRSGIASLRDDEKFEYFSAYCVLSSRFSEAIDIEECVTGSGNDLNIDAFAVKINGRIAEDASFVQDVIELNGYLEVEYIVIQAKTSSNFDGAAMIALGNNLRNQIFAENQSMPMNRDVENLVSIKNAINRNAAKLKENPVLWIYYVCTGNWMDDGYLKSVIADQRRDLMNTNLFSDVRYMPIGAREIQQLFRNTRSNISRSVRFDKLITLPKIDQVQASYLGILPFSEYVSLICDDAGELVKSVFVDNVRDFQGDNPVNTDIAQTIQRGELDLFVLRNNGITIVARNIKVTSSTYTLEDYQIVNGCQTSHVLYANKDNIQGDLFIPVKLIQTDNEEVAQSIIKSTNKQTPVEEDDLLALTKFQRDLEDYYNSTVDDCKLYYERRAKQYASQPNLEKGRIISIGTQLKCFASMFLDQPNQATRYQGTLLRSVNRQVFQQSHKVEPYYIAALTYYRFEAHVRRLQMAGTNAKSFRYYLLLAFRYRYEINEFPGAASKNVLKYCDGLLGRLVTQDLARDSFEASFDIVSEAIVNLGLPMARDTAKSRNLVDEVKRISLFRNSLVKQL